MKLEKFTLRVMHTRRGAGSSQIHSCTNWPAYIGGDIPEGFAACKSNQPGTCKPSSKWWFVHIKSRWPATHVEFSTRKDAIYAAKRMGEQWPDVDWTQDADTVIAAVRPRQGSMDISPRTLMERVIRELEAAT